MKQSLSLALLAGGVMLLFFGFDQSPSLQASFAGLFRHSAATSAGWLIILGVLALGLGAVGLFGPSKAS